MCRSTTIGILARPLQPHHRLLEILDTPLPLLLSLFPVLLFTISSPPLIVFLRPLDLLPLGQEVTNDTFPAEDVTMRSACDRVSRGLETEVAARKREEGVSV